MNRTDRLLAVVLELQARGWVRAEDLAGGFETSVRTIYRDMQALSESGVPLVAMPGRGYSLIEGYFLPPLMFSTAEAAMLLLGAGVMAASFDAQYRVAAANAARKIAAVLPEPIRRETQELRESVRFVPTRADVPDERLALLRRAIADRSPVRLRYHPRRPADGGSGATIRVIDPYVLARSAGSWYVTGHDHLRGTRRTFRLDRIEEIAVVGGRFERPPDAHVRHGERDVLPILIEALFAPEVARWVREDRSYFTEREEETAAGLIVTLRVRHERDVLSWLLGWGRHVRVLSPESLRALMRDEALALADAHAAPLPEGTADTLRGSVVGATSCVIVPADDDSRSARRDSSTPPAGSARNDGGGRRGSDNDAN